MASTFKNAAVALADTSRTDLYTTPATTTSVVHNLTISNIDGVNSADITIEFYDSSVTTYFKLAHLVPVPAGSTLIFDKPINLETGDKISLTASAGGDLSGFASVMQIT
jgi:hypothetical protein|tara:strand:+ start:857 stop:1183 length:327 start_codon:yes stop_codon:yes gene_type:complete